jgi:hypothetical protein
MAIGNHQIVQTLKAGIPLMIIILESEKGDWAVVMPTVGINSIDLNLYNPMQQQTATLQTGQIIE